MFRTLPFSYSFLCSFFLFFALAFSKLWIPLLESGDSCRSRSSRSSWPIFRSFWDRGSLPLCSSRGRRFLCLLDVWRRCARRRVDFQGCEKGWKTVICVSVAPWQAAKYREQGSSTHPDWLRFVPAAPSHSLFHPTSSSVWCGERGLSNPSSRTTVLVKFVNNAQTMRCSTVYISQTATTCLMG